LLWRAENAPRLDNYGGLIALAWHPETGLRTWGGVEHPACRDSGWFGWESIAPDDFTIEPHRWNSAAPGPAQGEFVIVDKNSKVWSRYGSKECIGDDVSFVMGNQWLTPQGEIFANFEESCTPTSVDSYMYLPPPGPWIYTGFAYFYVNSTEPSGPLYHSEIIHCVWDTNGRFWCGPGDAPYFEPFLDPTRCWVEFVVSPYRACGIDGDGVVECHYVEDAYAPFEPPPPDLRISHLKMYHEICGLDQDNIIRCWSTPGAQQQPPTDEPFVDFMLFQEGGCGLRPDGTIRCWGNPDYPLFWLNPDDPLPEPDCPWWP
jgi:hypothetical protein